jgi:hypothetical protein
MMEDFHNEEEPPPPPPLLAAIVDEIMDDNNNEAEEFNAATDGMNDDDEDGNEIVHFHYTRTTGGGGKVVPDNVTHVTVNPSVKMICRETFECCRSLTSVELPEGLECIGGGTFGYCGRLSRIILPLSVKVIEEYAFTCCESLESMDLPEGLELLGRGAFFACRSLHSIRIPLRVKSIERNAFMRCHELRNVELSEGLEYIGEQAFASCNLLRYLNIPSTVKDISPIAFTDSTIGGIYLNKLQFCDEIEEFVSGESLRDWWNNGISKCSLETYNFLVRCNIPARMDQLMGRWQANIHELLRSIPSIDFDDLYDYFNTIDSKLTDYESLPDVISVLELAIWKSKLSEQFGLDMENVSSMEKFRCRVECGACVIIPDVLSFL